MNAFLEKVLKWANEFIFGNGMRYFLSEIANLFGDSLNVLQTEAAKTPSAFSSSIVGTLRTISDSVIVPIAGLILTIIFCYELINMLLEKNNMAEMDSFNLFKVLMKTSLAIILLTRCFDITLAFFDVGQTLVSGITSSVTVSLSFDGIADALVADAGINLFMGAIYFIFTLIVWLASWVAIGLIYLIAWGRMIQILIYISVSPIPFATLMNRDWIGHIGQNYLKNLAALALQGFLMMVCMVVYAGLLSNILPIINAKGGLLGLVLILVSMFVCVKSLMSCQNLAKSIFGAV